MALNTQTNEQKFSDKIADVPVTNYSTILKTLIVISLISTIVFIVLSYLTRELGYILLTLSSGITLVFGFASNPRAPKKPAAFIVFYLLFHLSYLSFF